MPRYIAKIDERHTAGGLPLPLILLLWEYLCQPKVEIANEKVGDKIQKSDILY